MKVSLNWLNEYVAISSTPDEIAHMLTMVGLEVEGIEHITLDFSGVVVGSVLEKEKHPNADKLSVCKVNIGSEILSIVCGAQNVAVGQKVAVATIGAVLKDEFKIKPVKLRGVDSQGMICSERELGLSESHEGIMVLDEEHYPIGSEYKPMGFEKDVVFELSVTPNRPDCLSHIGVARELACALNQKLTLPDTAVTEADIETNSLAAIEIHDYNACPRYVTRIIQDVKIGPSPEWMKNRLEAVGIRSINNVVDITNYVLMETGQPLHAFDYDQISQNKIVVRKASENEEFITLDSQNRKLSSDDLLICDGNKGVALAGVMGGENSEVSDTTTDILLESAYFDPMTVRKTAKRLGMSTEASQRFERGADPENTIFAANRASHLFEKYASGKVACNLIDEKQKNFDKWKVSLRFSRIEKILGATIEKNNIIKILNGLEMLTEIITDDVVEVEIPTFRPDLTREIDLIEEVVRHHGYDVIEPKHSSLITLNYVENEIDFFIDEIKNIMTGLGFLETLSDSMVSEKHVTIVTPNIKPVVIKNPLSPDTTYMRTSILPGIFDAIQWNVNRAAHNLRFFEIGKIFKYDDTSKPYENLELGIAITGESRPADFWGASVESSNFYQLKGVLETLLSKLNINNYKYLSEENQKYQTGMWSLIQIDNKIVGEIGLISQDIIKKTGLEKDVFSIQLSITELMSCVNKDIKYKQIAKFPAVKRDLAVVADLDLPIQALKDIIIKRGSKLLKSVGVFDLYQGDQIPENKKSIAFSLEFISEERTLTEGEIEPIMSKIISELKNTYQCTLRS